MCCQETAEPLATASRNAAEQGPNLSDGTSGVNWRGMNRKRAGGGGVC